MRTRVLIFISILSSCGTPEPISSWRDLKAKEYKTEKEWRLQDRYFNAVKNKLRSDVSFEDIPSSDGKVDGFSSSSDFLIYECLSRRYMKYFNNPSIVKVLIRGEPAYIRNNKIKRTLKYYESLNEKSDIQYLAGGYISERCSFGDYNYDVLLIQTKKVGQSE